jgi:hypothetical protein
MARSPDGSCRSIDIAAQRLEFVMVGPLFVLTWKCHGGLA